MRLELSQCKVCLKRERCVALLLQLIDWNVWRLLSFFPSVHLPSDSPPLPTPTITSAVHIFHRPAPHTQTPAQIHKGRLFTVHHTAAAILLFFCFFLAAITGVMGVILAGCSDRDDERSRECARVFRTDHMRRANSTFFSSQSKTNLTGQLSIS